MSKAPAAAPKAAQSTVNRNRRNSFMRKCLSKGAKRLFKGSDSIVFRMIAAVERPTGNAGEKAGRDRILLLKAKALTAKEITAKALPLAA